MSTEFEHGIVRPSRPRHNGYHAGNFDNHPFPSEQQFRLLMSLQARHQV